MKLKKSDTVLFVVTCVLAVCGIVLLVLTNAPKQITFSFGGLMLLGLTLVALTMRMFSNIPAKVNRPALDERHRQFGKLISNCLAAQDDDLALGQALKELEEFKNPELKEANYPAEAYLRYEKLREAHPEIEFPKHPAPTMPRTQRN